MCVYSAAKHGQCWQNGSELQYIRNVAAAEQMLCLSSGH